MRTIEALKRLHKETHAEVYLVGGFVRDYLRNKRNDDLDIVVCNMLLADVQTILSKMGTVKEVHIAKSSDTAPLTILLFKGSDRVEAQITLPRRGKKQTPSHTNRLEQDAALRDFKVNAMYLPVDFKSKKDVIDFAGGRADIANRRITANGNAMDRIKESPIRMLRAISLSARTNYALCPELVSAIKNCRQLLSNCPAENIRAEFNEILLSKQPVKYLYLMKKTMLLNQVAPEIAKCCGIKQDARYHKYDVFTHLIHTVGHCDRDLVLRLAGLLHDVGKSTTKKEHGTEPDIRITFHKHEMASTKLAKDFLLRLRYDNEVTKSVLLLVKHHMYHYTREWTDSAVRKFIKRVGLTEEYISEEKISDFPLFKLRSAERLGNGLKGTAVTDRQKDFEYRIIALYRASKGLEIKDLHVDGNKIMEIFNLKPGVQIGNVLKFLLDHVLEDPDLNNELDLLKLTTEYLHEASA